MKNVASHSIPLPKADDATRAAIEAITYRSPEQLTVRKKGFGADGRENLEVDETLIYSLLAASETVRGSIHDMLNGNPTLTPFRTGIIQPITVTSWTGEPVIIDGRQRRKAAEEINDRMGMIVEFRKKLGEDAQDLASLRNKLIEKSQLAPKSWGWATAEALPLYIGGRVGDAKLGFDAPGLIDETGAPIPYKLWTVYRDLDPESIQMQVISSAAEHARVKTPPTKLAQRVQTMLTQLPMSHVARILGVTENTLKNRLLILRVEREVQEALDIGGEDGGISWNQLVAEMFTKGANGMQPLPPAEQLAKLEKIRGTVKRGAKPGEKRGGKPADPAVPTSTPPTTPSTNVSPKSPSEPTAPAVTVVKLSPKTLITFASSLEKGADGADENAAQDMQAMSAVLRFLAGDGACLDEFPTAKEVLTAALKKLGGEGAVMAAPPVAPAPAGVPVEVTTANAVLDLAEQWTKTRTKSPLGFSPNWPQGEHLSREVSDALAQSQSTYRKYEDDCRANDEDPEAPELWIETWVNENLLTVRGAA